jgi:hypothetical protein
MRSEGVLRVGGDIRCLSRITSTAAVPGNNVAEWECQQSGTNWATCNDASG